MSTWLVCTMYGYTDTVVLITGRRCPCLRMGLEQMRWYHVSICVWNLCYICCHDRMQCVWFCESTDVHGVRIEEPSVCACVFVSDDS